MAKGNGKANGAAKPPVAVGTTERDDYALKHAPTLVAAMTIRRNPHNANDVVDQAIRVCNQLWDVVYKATIGRREGYVLEQVPTTLAAMMIRRPSTKGEELIPEAISCVERIWDVVHEMDVPAEAMMSQPVDLRH